MGLLKALFGKKPKEEPAKQQKPTKKKHLGELVLEGDEERRVYTYDVSPLKGISEGQAFYAEAVARRVRLRSPYSGEIWDTSEGGVAYAVKGAVFGASNTLDETIKGLMRDGFTVKVKMKHVGAYDSRVPEIVMLVPESNEVFEWRDACKRLGRAVPFEDRHSPEAEAAAEKERERFKLERAMRTELPDGTDGVVIWLEKDKWGGAKPRKGVAKIDLCTEWVPVPEGSKAKPHIAIVEDGKPVAEINARNGCYKFLAAHVGEKPIASTCERYKREAPGDYAWRVAIAYEGAQDV